MSPDPLDALVEALGGSDEAAVERAFRTFEPVLRTMVRRVLTLKRILRHEPLDLVVLIDNPGLNLHVFSLGYVF